MIAIIALIAGIVIGAIGMAVLGQSSGAARRPALGGAARRLLGRPRPEDTPLGRDLSEHAGGSRHIRTNPSWRDRLE
ncbi:hypothetical protein ACFQZZ_16560 [Nocardia sp. GCM10030253]|uniref:hypothetical protein n=1 Tax=Nocardia sp. GCM10030253 TaxID=3273404 RepID=UPI0036399FA7